MLGIHTILHPTDFSEHSEFALRLAGALARDYGARLIVLHVFEPPPLVYGEVMLPPPLEDLRSAAQQQLDQLSVPDVNVRVQRRLEQGDSVLEILHVAREAVADLIVMGTHGRTGLKRLLMGSVAERVTRQAPCPVLTVRTPFPETMPVTTPAAEEVLAGAGI